MADDIEIGGPDLAHIAAPAATDRVPLSTGSASGGYSRRDEFIWKDATGKFVGTGSLDLAGSTMSIQSSDNFNGYVRVANTLRAWGMGMFGAPGWERWSLYDMAASEERLTITPAGDMGLGASAPSANSFARTFQITGTTPAIVFNGTTGAKKYATGVTGSGNFVVRDDTLNVTRLILFPGGAFAPGADNTQAWGDASLRWSGIYLGSNPIVTCDVRFKTYRAEPGPSAAELRAALRSIEEFGFFQSNDAIELKGADDARWHFGPRAQGVWAICAEEELCNALIEVEVIRNGVATTDLLPPAGSIPPAFLCFDEWDEETAQVMEDVEIPAALDGEGNEIEPARIEQQPTGETYVTRPAGNRFGVRIDQLHSLMIAALNAERLKQEAMITDLVARVVALEPAP